MTFKSGIKLLLLALCGAAYLWSTNAQRMLDQERDRATARRLAQECVGGTGRSCFQLAKLFEEGRGVKRDLSRASKLYLIAAESGVKEALMPMLDTVAKQALETPVPGDSDMKR